MVPISFLLYFAVYVVIYVVNFDLLQFSRAHLDSLLAYCQKGVDEGATLVYGGKRVERPGITKINVYH